MLTAYRITFSNGRVIETSMAADVTLKMARAYFLGNPNRFEFVEGEPSASAVKVEQIRAPAKAVTAE